MFPEELHSSPCFLPSGNLPGRLSCFSLCPREKHSSHFLFLFVLLKSGQIHKSSICLILFPRLSEIRTSLSSLKEPLKLVPTLWPLGTQTTEKRKFPNCCPFFVCMLYITWLYILSESPLEKPCGH
jgi:hypothetical protein